jgi:hypothetical protein
MSTEQFYKKWCKETKRNGGTLIGSSIQELLEAHKKHLTDFKEDDIEALSFDSDSGWNEVERYGWAEGFKYAINLIKK